jgi:hypothetical protein
MGFLGSRHRGTPIDLPVFGNNRSAGRPGAGLMRAGLVVGAVIVALEVVDVLTTLRMVAAGGFELNPLMSMFMGLLGPLWWMPKVLLASGAAGYFATRPSVRWPAIVVIIFCAVIALNNVVQLLA